MGVGQGVMTALPGPLPRATHPVSDRATLDRSADELCAEFAVAWTHRVSWGAWSRLRDLVPGHPAFVLRQGAQGLGLDTQRWDISGGEACWPTTRIFSLTLPWWRRLAEVPAQRCLIPVTAARGALSSPDGREDRPVWFTLDGQPVFTVAGLWRRHAGAHGFAMLGCAGGEGPWSTLPMIVAPEDRARWLGGDWADVTALQNPSPVLPIRIGLCEGPAASYERCDRDSAWPPSRRTARG